VWKSQRLLDKTSWSGNLETMQYFATLSYFNPAASLAEVAAVENGGDEYWLTNEIIDVPLVSPQVQSPESCGKRFGESASINSSGPSMNNDDVTSSSSSNYLAKGNKCRVRIFEMTV